MNLRDMQQWEVAQCGWRELKRWLEAGWEPYAVTEVYLVTTFYLRRLKPINL